MHSNCWLELIVRFRGSGDKSSGIKLRYVVTNGNGC